MRYKNHYITIVGFGEHGPTVLVTRSGSDEILYKTDRVCKAIDAIDVIASQQELPLELRPLRFPQ